MRRSEERAGDLQIPVKIQITSVMEACTRRQVLSGIASSNVPDEALECSIEINHFEVKIFRDVHGKSSSTVTAGSGFGNNLVVIRDAIKRNWTNN